jgi:hypothetical protein
MTDHASQPGLQTIFAAIGLFLLGFAACAAAIHLSIRDPLHLHADGRSEKLAILDRGSFQSAAFGSSHIINGFDPRVFDRDLAGTTLATHTVNLAVSGGSQSEQFAMAREFLRHLHPSPESHACLVTLELNAGANFTPDHLVHPRAIDVYDWPTARLISRMVDRRMTLTQRLGRAGFAFAAMGLHYANVGMLSNRVFSPPLDADMLARQTIDDRRGQQIDPVPAAFTAEIVQEIDALPRQTALQTSDLTPGNTEMIAQLSAAAPMRGVAFVYLVTPKLSNLRSSVDYPDHIEAAGQTVPIVNLARPDRYPQLYAAPLWHDNAHLDAQGAAMATALFATELKQWYSAHGGPPQCGG